MVDCKRIYSPLSGHKLHSSDPETVRYNTLFVSQISVRQVGGEDYVCEGQKRVARVCAQQRKEVSTYFQHDRQVRWGGPLPPNRTARILNGLITVIVLWLVGLP